MLKQHGHAEKLPTPKYMDMVCNEVSVADKTCGLPVKDKLLYHECVLCMDERGCNTNQKTDGKVGGKKWTGMKGSKAPKTAAMTNKCFTLLPIMNSLGQPVCCVVIFQGEGDNC